MTDAVTVIVPLRGLPEVPELFRPAEQPLGLCPFPLKPAALAALGALFVQEPNG